MNQIKIKRYDTQTGEYEDINVIGVKPVIRSLNVGDIVLYPEIERDVVRAACNVLRKTEGKDFSTRTIYIDCRRYIRIARNK